MADSLQGKGRRSRAKSRAIVRACSARWIMVGSVDSPCIPLVPGSCVRNRLQMSCNRFHDPAAIASRSFCRKVRHFGISRNPQISAALLV